jgi:hypothetical protein
MTTHIANGSMFPAERIFFYDAQSPNTQPEMERLTRLVNMSDIFLTGSGNSLYQGILSLRTETDKLKVSENKERMRAASAEIIEGLREEIDFQRRIRFLYAYKDNNRAKLKYENTSVATKIVETWKAKIPNWVSSIGRKKGGEGAAKVTGGLEAPKDDSEEENIDEYRDKELQFTAEGRVALRVLQSVGHPMRSAEAKYRTTVLLHRAQKRGLVLTRMENATVSVGPTRKQLVSYLLVDVDEKLDAAVYKRIETILAGLVGRRQDAEPILEEMNRMAISDSMLTAAPASTKHTLHNIASAGSSTIGLLGAASSATPASSAGAAGAGQPAPGAASSAAGLPRQSRTSSISSDYSPYNHGTRGIGDVSDLPPTSSFDSGASGSTSSGNARAPLPPGRIATTSLEGQVCYPNPQTTATMWDRQVRQPALATAPVAPSSGGAVALPLGWTTTTAPDGSLYYCNPTTGASSWDPPTY